MRAKEFLLEYNRQITTQNFGDAILNVIKKDMSPRLKLMGFDKDKFSIPEYQDLYKEKIIAEIEKIDPTPHKEYTQWLCKIYATGQVKFEDLESRGADALTRFQKLKIKKQLKPEHADINRIKTFQQFEQIVASYPEPQDVVVDKGTANLFHEDESLRIIVPLDETASRYYGQGTKWCTAANKNCQFENYHKKGHLYILLPTQQQVPNEKWQFHFEAGQYMNLSDEPLNDKEWDALLARFPQLLQIFSKQAEDNLCIPLMPNRQDIIEFWDMMQTSVAGSVAERLPFPRISTILRREFPSGAAAAPNIATPLINDFLRDLRNDRYGVMEIFMDAITPYNFNDGELYFDVINDVLSSWLTESSVGERITDLDDRENYKSEVVIDAMGAYIELTSVIFNAAMPLVKEEAQKFFQIELPQLKVELN